MTDYPYARMPLRPGVFCELALELFGDGRPIQRAEMIQKVNDYHLSSGGTPAVTNLTAVCKKALKDMVARGQARSAGVYGIWLLGSAENPTALDLDDELDELDSEPDLIEQASAATQYVYVYDLPTYAEHAAAKGNERWPHKIGYTTVSAKERIADQVGTALPEHPRIVITLPCERAKVLEKALHAVLELRGQRITSGPGTEWFNTNPTEIRALIEFILGSDTAEVEQPSPAP